MDKLIDKLIEKLGNIMDQSRDYILLEDDIYIQDNNDKEKLENLYNALELNEHDKIVINEYISCINTMNNRVSDISYIAGVSDTVKLLNGLELLKKYEK